jgi:curved DNA-binding protein CbpA
LLAIEALEVLALRPGATPVQIKEAYRDLVKVWHPDRFGSDARLRAKAEEKLQRINEAYRVLQSDVGAVPSYEAKGAGTVRGDVSSPRYSSYSPVAARSGGGSNRAVMGWFYVCVGILVALVGYLVILNPAKITEPTVPAVVLNPVVPRTPGGVSGGRVARPAEASPRGSDAGNSTGAAQFQVRSLSEAETERMEETCEPQRDRLGQTGYQVCVAAQVAVITNRGGRPDLSALNAAERESIESTCAEARRVGGLDGGDRCLTVKMAEWAAELARPNLSTLNEADRSSVELACRGARDAQGPAAYDRCLVRFMKALADSR